MRESDPWLPDIVLAVLGLAAGLWIGVLFTFAHRSTPLLVVGVLAVGCLTAGLRLLSPRRVPAAAAAVGVLLAIGVLVLRGPGGSVVVENDALGWAWQLGAVAVAAVALAWPRIGPPRAGTMER